MNLSQVFAIFGSIVTVALVTVVVTNSSSATIIAAIGDLFTGSLRAAMGR